MRNPHFPSFASIAALATAVRAGLPAVLVRERELEETAVERLVAAVRATLRGGGGDDRSGARRRGPDPGAAVVGFLAAFQAAAS